MTFAEQWFRRSRKEAWLRVVPRPARVLRRAFAAALTASTLWACVADGEACGQESSADAAAAATPAAEDEARLRFNFRRQPWGDVLQWLADQADLSLVLDAPPPGSFNYSDSKTYTASEAIDLVNGVLASKGYTLVRRERMLTLVNLQDAVPRILVPKVSLEEIEQRGQYEFVTVALPLEGRNAEAALAEIKPLISEYGEASALPASGQLLVTERAGLIPQVSSVLQAMPRPKTPSPPAASTPEAKVFRAYPLEGADAAAAVKILEAVIDGNFAHDPAGDLVNAYATPSQHLVVEQLIEQVRGAADKQKLNLEIYPIEGLSAERQAQLTSDLQAAAPTATMRFDPASEQLAVWANARQHLDIRRALLTLLAAGAASSNESAQVYRLEHADAAGVAPLLQSALPKARVNQVGSTDRLVAIAGPQDQRLLAQLVEQLDQPDRGTPRIFKEYALEREPPDQLAQLLAEVAPDADVRVDASRRTVVATADQEDQQTIADFLESMQQNLQPRAEQTLEVYVLNKVQQERYEDAQALMEQTAPGARLMWDRETGELFAWALPEQQQAIADLLESLDAAPPRPATQRFRAYSVTGDAEGVLAMIAKVAPDAVTAVDRRGRRLLVWADQADHQQLEPILAPADDVRRSDTDPAGYRAYPAAGIDIALAVRLLGEVFPAAEFEPDLSAQSIVVRADLEQHHEIKTMIEELVDGSASVGRYRVDVYPLGAVALTQAQGLPSLFPSMRMTIDAATHQVTAWGTQEDHQSLRQALESLGGGEANGAWEIKTFSLRKARAIEVAQGLQQLAPGVSAAAINESQLLVRGPSASMTEIEDLITQLDQSRNRAENQLAEAIPVQFADADALLGTLRALFPPTEQTYFSYDARMHSLIAVIDREQLPLVKAVVEAADQQGDVDTTVQAHPLGGVDPTSAMTTLQELFKQRGRQPLISSDAARNRLVVVATPEDQKLVDHALETLRPMETALEVFSLETIDPYAAETAIAQLFDSAAVDGSSPVEVEADSDGGRILVRATPKQLQEIRDLLLKLGEMHLVATAPHASGTRFVPWKVDNLDQAIEEIEATWRLLRPNQLRRGPRPPADSSPENGAAKQSETDQNAATPGEPEADRDVQEKPDEAAPPSSSAPRGNNDAKPVYITATSAGVAIASEDGDAINQLSNLIRAYGQGGTPQRGDFGVYPLKHASAERISEVLKDVYSRNRSGLGRMQFAADDRINAVVAVGTRAQRREVEALVEILDAESAPEFNKPVQPVILPLQHASARQVLSQLQTLYSTELKEGGKQPPIEIPPGASPELVATLQQINAARQGPLLSLEVDSDSNSLLVIAPRLMLDEIRNFVSEVDQASMQSRVGVRVIQLQSVKGDELLRSLEDIVIERR